MEMAIPLAIDGKGGDGCPFMNERGADVDDDMDECFGAWLCSTVLTTDGI